jgi:hypothetical protein
MTTWWHVACWIFKVTRALVHARIGAVTRSHTHTRTHTHTHTTEFPLNNFFVNTPQCYVICTMPPLFLTTPTNSIPLRFILISLFYSCVRFSIGFALQALPPISCTYVSFIISLPMSTILILSYLISLKLPHLISLKLPHYSLR